MRVCFLWELFFRVSLDRVSLHTSERVKTPLPSPIYHDIFYHDAVLSQLDVSLLLTEWLNITIGCLLTAERVAQHDNWMPTYCWQSGSTLQLDAYLLLTEWLNMTINPTIYFDWRFVKPLVTHTTDSIFGSYMVDILIYKMKFYIVKKIFFLIHTTHLSKIKFEGYKNKINYFLRTYMSIKHILREKHSLYHAIIAMLHGTLVLDDKRANPQTCGGGGGRLKNIVCTVMKMLTILGGLCNTYLSKSLQKYLPFQ